MQAEINALAYRTTTVCDAVGHRIALVDARTNRHSFVYDAVGRETLRLDPLSRTTTYGYDAAGQQTTPVDAHGNTTTYTSDDDSRLTKTRSANSIISRPSNWTACHFNDSSLAGIGHLENLRRLKPAETSITDAEIVHLEPLTSLEKLWIDQTALSPAAVARLKAALPDCEIKSDADDAAKPKNKIRGR